MEATAEARIEANLQSINTKLDTISDRLGGQNERIARVEGRQDGLETAIKGVREDEVQYETNHSGPNGDHDRLANFHLAMITIFASVAVAAFSSIAYLWMR